MFYGGDHGMALPYAKSNMYETPQFLQSRPQPVK
jgi:hypothetical protein